MKAAPNRKVTLLDVARWAQVDPSVVSRVLNGDPTIRVRQATRERILKAAQELGYRPNAVARTLRTARAGAYGLLVPDFANPVYAFIIKGAEAAAAAQGCVLLTGSVSRDLGGYFELLGQGRVDGLLVADARAGESLAHFLDSLGIPWILLNQRIPSVKRYVILDDETAAKLAVRHLVDLGHRDIAHITGPADADTAARRLLGYSQVLREVGLEPDPRWVIAADFTYHGGAVALRRLYELEHRPTAVFVANIASAIGALRVAQELGWRVPEELSIVTIHDMPLVEYLYPSLTTVQMPLEELGRRGLELLSSLPADTTIHEVIREPIRLVVRDSTAPPRGKKHE